MLFHYTTQYLTIVRTYEISYCQQQKLSNNLQLEQIMQNLIMDTKLKHNINASQNTYSTKQLFKIYTTDDNSADVRSFESLHTILLLRIINSSVHYVFITSSNLLESFDYVVVYSEHIWWDYLSITVLLVENDILPSV